MSTITQNSVPAPTTRRPVRDEMIAFALMTIVLAVVPFTGVYPFFVMQGLCFALLACAFNLLIGYGGLLSFGHAMFLGTAGYVSAHALKVWELPPELGIVAGVVAAFGLSVITGLIAIRRQGIYFAMITLALSQLLYFIYLQAPFTHGEDGIQGIPQGKMFGIIDLQHTTTLYFVILIGFLIGFLIIYRAINSPFGEVLKAIRENEPRAISLGYKTDQYKLLAFILSGTLAGFAGALKVFVAQNASLTDVHWSMSGEIVLMTLVGGLGTIFGPVVGAFVIIAMQQYLAGFGQWVTVIQGVIFVACVLTFRRGIVGEIGHYFKRSL
ncbi:inner-membrane translocator [Rhodopseudomonas palustris HaA2]|uniref:Inner-membrane translocator n=1 Tax=Rhodopseudomonas palustris (strain HaA2) TaxID=316058 RepID=Q2IVA0_RHOP2|nr:branched-chain amino acid ABC transporter permease [Rhodopseudomonas palustris]ABD07860.1 inner-membrane translocator [Rhodopseudomonas palustris HaA2]